MGSTTPDPRCADVQRGRVQGRRIGEQQQQQQRQQQEVKMARESAPQQHQLRGIGAIEMGTGRSWTWGGDGFHAYASG